jgi:hypothetical protein
MNSIIDAIMRFFRPDNHAENHDEEEELKRQIAFEQRRLQQRQARADRILREFYHAEAVVKGSTKGDRN